MWTSIHGRLIFNRSLRCWSNTTTTHTILSNYIPTRSFKPLKFPRVVFESSNRPIYWHLTFACVPMDCSFAPFTKILRKLWLFKPPLSRSPLPNHSCPKALFLGNASFKLPYLLAHTPNWGVFEHSKIPQRHKLFIAHERTLVTPSLCGWAAFPMHGGLTHIMITWALPPMAPQV
jgi:hypothetical protein